MKIQIISHNSLSNLQDSDFTISRLSNPRSLDEFDVDIIDLSSEILWRNSANGTNTIESIRDFKSISEMVKRKTKANVVYVFPMNCRFSYHYAQMTDRSKGYIENVLLKDCLDSVKQILSKALSFERLMVPLIFESTTTTITGQAYPANFYFDGYGNTITKSDISNKVTTVRIQDKVFCTTLQILERTETVLNYLEFILPSEEHDEVPEWMYGIKILDDSKLEDKIATAREQIKELEENISNAELKLNENDRIKSILYTNGADLVDEVFSILEQLLSCDLSKFVDEKKEDFQIKKEAYTLIGEIKGVTSNIKNEHISQVDVHYQGYIDKIVENGIQENVHQVLIINPFRSKPPSEREPIHDNQIKLAIRNGCLIIDTMTLLKLYEKFMACEVDVMTCEHLFTEKIGLLKEEDFCKDGVN